MAWCSWGWIGGIKEDSKHATWILSRIQIALKPNATVTPTENNARNPNTITAIC